MPKYAPANENGSLPYIVTGSNWGRPISRLIYARDNRTAKFNIGLRGTGQYVISARRALASEIEGWTDRD